MLEMEYYLSYLWYNELHVSEDFREPVSRVFRQLPPDVIREIANDDKAQELFLARCAENYDDCECRPPVLIAPSIRYHGLILDPRTISDDALYVYLSAELLDQERFVLEGAIALQFAHVLLQQPAYLSDTMAEMCRTRTAIELAEQWGFVVPPGLVENAEEVDSEDDSANELLGHAISFWVGREYRQHLRHVFARLPEPVLSRLEKLKPVFLAPDRNTVARTFSVSGFDEIKIELAWLSPSLLNISPSRIWHVIARELAHLYLEHPMYVQGDARDAGERQEAEADQLASAWGFPNI